MRKRFSVFAAFFTSLCAVCAFLIMALVLGSMTGCSPVGSSIRRAEFVVIDF